MSATAKYGYGLPPLVAKPPESSANEWLQRMEAARLEREAADLKGQYEIRRVEAEGRNAVQLAQTQAAASYNVAYLNGFVSLARQQPPAPTPPPAPPPPSVPVCDWVCWARRIAVLAGAAYAAFRLWMLIESHFGKNQSRKR
jgi:hypothetical protein